MIYLAFYRGEGRFLSDTLVQLVTRSEFSHCELFSSDTPPVSGETHTCITAVGKKGGVCVKDVHFRPGAYEFVPVPWAPSDTLEKAIKLLGQGYDYWGLLMTQFLNLRRHTGGRWFCSKLAAFALGMSEAHTYAPGDLKRIIEEKNKVYQLAQLTRGVDAPSVEPDLVTEPLPGRGIGLPELEGLIPNNPRNKGTIVLAEGEWQAHVQKPRKYPVRARQALRTRIAPTVIARSESTWHSRAEPFQLNAAGGTGRAELVNFPRAGFGQNKLDGRANIDTPRISLNHAEPGDIA